VSKNEEETRFHLIDPVLRRKGYDDPQRIRLETPAPIEPTGHKGRRSKRAGRTDYLLCVQVGDMPRALPVAVLEAKREDAHPLAGMDQAKGYADCARFDVHYVFASNGHLYGEYDKPSGLQTGPHPLEDFPPHADLCARYARDKGLDLAAPDAAVLFQPDSPAWNHSRYYQDAAIRAALQKMLLARQAAAGDPAAPGARVLLTLATGAGKTIIATNLLWRMAQAGWLDKPALFVCDRDELRGQAHDKLSAAFGSNARIVQAVRGRNAAANARIHIATYQTLGIDGPEPAQPAADQPPAPSFLSRHYAENAFSVIIIDECHRSAWGHWRELLTRNPQAIHIGLTATPRQLAEPRRSQAKRSKPETGQPEPTQPEPGDEARRTEAEGTEADALAAARAADEAITAHNLRYFGEPVYQYTLAQAQEDGYLAACELVKRKASIDDAVFTREEVLKAGARDLKTGRLLTADDLPKPTYTGKDFDRELFIDLRTPRMCEDLFRQLCANGGPEQKVIIFCTRDLHADLVVMQMNNLYADWCATRGRQRKDLYAFKCTAASGADKIEAMRGSGERAFIACSVDLLEAGVDIERLNAVVFFRYLQSAIKFHQMVGRGTRIHEETRKYKFWLYDYTGVSDLFGAGFVTAPAAERKPRKPDDDGPGGDDDEDDGPGGAPAVAEMRAPYEVVINAGGRFILVNRGGQATPMPVDEYRAEVLARVLAEARNLDDFRALWVQARRRRQLIDHLLAGHLSPDAIRHADRMDDFDLFDFFGQHGYHARALTRTQRGAQYLDGQAAWFADMPRESATVLRGLGQQFARGGTEAVESAQLWALPEIARAGGLDALRRLGPPAQVMQDAKMRLFGV